MQTYSYWAHLSYRSTQCQIGERALTLKKKWNMCTYTLVPLFPSLLSFSSCRSLPLCFSLYLLYSLFYILYFNHKFMRKFLYILYMIYCMIYWLLFALNVMISFSDNLPNRNWKVSSGKSIKSAYQHRLM
jgi:hypothetical protein